MNLALKYRPKKFCEGFIEQNTIAVLLSKQLETRQFKNVYTFTGASGVGKTTAARIFATAINHGVNDAIEIDAASNNGVDQVRAIVESANKRSLTGEYKIFIIDECFVGDTLINTADGVKKIKDIIPGDRVMTLNGFSNVTYVHQKKVENSMLNYMRLSDGRTITTTADHLFLTTRGWIESKNLIQGDILLDAKNMPKLWKTVHNKTQGTEVLQQQMSNGISEQTQSKGFDRENLSYLWETILCRNKEQSKKELLNGMQKEVNIAIREDNNELRIWDGAKEIIIYKNDKSKSDEEFTNYREDALNERIEWNATSMEREKRGQWLIYRTSAEAMRGIRRFLNAGITNKNELLSEQSEQVCFVLQSRPWLTRDEVSSRGGWQFSQMEKEYCARYEKDYLSQSVRVESIEVFQPGSNGELRNGCSKDTLLYDLTIEGSPTYFANGILVHNCHMITKEGWNAFLKCIEEPPKYTIFIFCSTNPEKIPATILNRSQRYNLAPISMKGIYDRLTYICEQEGFTNYNETCEYISKLAFGSMRQAIQYLDQVADYSHDLTLSNTKLILGDNSYEAMVNLTLALIDRSESTILKIVDQLYSKGKDLKVFIETYLDFALDLIKFKLFNSIDITNIPSYLNQVMPESKTSILEQLVEPGLNYLNNLADALLDIKTSIKYDTSYKSTICIKLIKFMRG